MSENKKRKVDTENRQFKPEWEEQFLFTLPDHFGAKPTCLLCLQTVAVIKSDNLKRYYTKLHKEFDVNYPPNSDKRKNKVHSLGKAYQDSKKILIRTFTAQENATEASLKVSWILAKHKQPFVSSEIVKECMVEVAKSVFPGDKKIEETLEQVPLSDSTNCRRVEVLSDDITQQLKNDLSKAEWCALALDESTDIRDMAQLAVYVRFYNDKQFVESLLAIAPLEGQTRGEDNIRSSTRGSPII